MSRNGSKPSEEKQKGFRFYYFPFLIVGLLRVIVVAYTVPGWRISFCDKKLENLQGLDWRIKIERCTVQYVYVSKKGQSKREVESELCLLTGGKWLSELLSLKEFLQWGTLPVALVNYLRKTLAAPVLKSGRVWLAAAVLLNNFWLIHLIIQEKYHFWIELPFLYCLSWVVDYFVSF